jgi:hypothetical protein
MLVAAADINKNVRESQIRRHGFVRDRQRLDDPVSPAVLLWARYVAPIAER